MLQDAITKIKYLQTTLAKMELTYQKIVNPEKTSSQEEFSKEKCQTKSKRSAVGSIFKWLFGGGDDSSETTKQLRENITILKQNQNLTGCTDHKLF